MEEPPVSTRVHNRVGSVVSGKYFIAAVERPVERYTKVSWILGLVSFSHSTFVSAIEVDLSVVYLNPAIFKRLVFSIYAFSSFKRNRFGSGRFLPVSEISLDIEIFLKLNLRTRAPVPGS